MSQRVFGRRFSPLPTARGRPFLAEAPAVCARWETARPGGIRGISAARSFADCTPRERLPQKEGVSASCRHQLDRLWAERIEEADGRIGIEPRIACLDAEKKAVLRGACETPGVEDRMIELRQTVEREHADGGKQ